jgi:hypothetical protein
MHVWSMQGYQRKDVFTQIGSVLLIWRLAILSPWGRAHIDTATSNAFKSPRGTGTSFSM